MSESNPPTVSEEHEHSLAQSVAALEHAVGQWIKSRAAWDSRKHGVITQFLDDIRLHATIYPGPGSVTSAAILLQLDRLDRKICSPNVTEKIDDLRVFMMCKCAGAHPLIPAQSDNSANQRPAPIRLPRARSRLI